MYARDKRYNITQPIRETMINDTSRAGAAARDKSGGAERNATAGVGSRADRLKHCGGKGRKTRTHVCARSGEAARKGLALTVFSAHFLPRILLTPKVFVLNVHSSLRLSATRTIRNYLFARASVL